MCSSDAQSIPLNAQTDHSGAKKCPNMFTRRLDTLMYEHQTDFVI
jgi:hypothetical protein